MTRTEPARKAAQLAERAGRAMVHRPMTWRLRSTALVVALGLASLLSEPGPSEPGEPVRGECETARVGVDQGPDPNSAATCGQCHVAIYEEWKGRAHNNAWVNELYQAEVKTKTTPESCYGCHIPLDVHQRLGRKPQPRDQSRDEGVTCVSCHKSAATKDDILGPFGAKTDAHPSQKHAAFTGAGSISLCASCHNLKIGPVLPLGRDHDTYREKLGDKAKTCVECHMPEIERELAVSIVTGKPVGEKRMTRSHVVLGPRDVEYCKKAFGLAARADGKDLVLSIENQAGHRIPGLTLRQFAVAIAQLGRDGGQLSTHAITLSHENGLKVLETREFRFDLAAGAASVEVRIDHVFEEKVVATVVSEKITL